MNDIEDLRERLGVGAEVPDEHLQAALDVATAKLDVIVPTDLRIHVLYLEAQMSQAVAEYMERTRGPVTTDAAGDLAADTWPLVGITPQAMGCVAPIIPAGIA